MFELIEVSNSETEGNKVIGEVHHFKYDGMRFRFGRITSSTVAYIKKADNILTVITRNSEYTFQEEK